MSNLPPASICRHAEPFHETVTRSALCEARAICCIASEKQSGQTIMRAVRVFVILVLAFGLAACGDRSSSATTAPKSPGSRSTRPTARCICCTIREVLEAYDIKLGSSRSATSSSRATARRPKAPTDQPQEPAQPLSPVAGDLLPERERRGLAESAGQAAGRRHLHPRRSYYNGQQQGRLDRRLHRRDETARWKRSTRWSSRARRS